MSQQKIKGSIILEILIVILIIGLVATILYPKRVWQQADENTVLCHKNMDRILKAELIYLKYNNTYTDTLENLFSFITSDTTSALKMEYLYTDTTLSESILSNLRERYKKADDIITNHIADTLLYTILATSHYDSNLANVILKRFTGSKMADSLTTYKQIDSSKVWILEKLSKIYGTLDIVNPLHKDDSLKIVMQRMKPEIITGTLVDTLYKNEEWASKIDSAINYTFNLIKYCPTNSEIYEITVDDTSVVKSINIHCPLDSIEIENSKKDFIKHFFGHLRLENHGNIKAGEKSWLN